FRRVLFRSSPGHDELVFFRQLVHTQDGDDVLKLCVALQHLLHAPGYLVVLFSDDTRFQNTGGGAEGVHRRVNTLLRDAPLQVRRRVQVSEGGGRRGVGVVVRRHVNGLNGRNGAPAGRRNPLLELTQFRGQRRLVTYRGGHPAQQR